MPSSRRTFVRQITHGVIGTWALTAIPLNSRARYILPGSQAVDSADEDFWKIVRDQFPLNHERVYFNNGTIGPSPFVVTEATKHALDTVDATGQYGGWEDTRGKLAKFVGADEAEISLTHNVTEGINIVAWGLPLKRGDEVIMTTHEHVGNA